MKKLIIATFTIAAFAGSAFAQNNTDYVPGDLLGKKSSSYKEQWNATVSRTSSPVDQSKTYVLGDLLGKKSSAYKGQHDGTIGAVASAEPGTTVYVLGDLLDKKKSSYKEELYS